MFALVFHFPAGRYHATPWGRNANEADVAWPPEPWRLLRALIATYWRKGSRDHWPEESLERLIDALAETPPVYHLPRGVIHAHSRHYMPVGTIEKGREKTTLVFDAFVRLPRQAAIVAAWPEVTLDAERFALAADLAAGIGYLGRAESWTECEALSEWNGEANCGPLEMGFSGDPVRLLAPAPPATYAATRARLMADAKERICAASKRPPTPKKIAAEVAKSFRSRGSGMDTLPARLVEALMLDTADYQDRGWPRPPAAREVVYAREPGVAPGVVPRRPSTRQHGTSPMKNLPTVARFLLAGRPRPRVEDTIRIGELMRLAALSQFGWRYDEATDRKFPKAPWQISGRGPDGTPLRHPSHAHAFWLPEDADSDGLIDHVSIFIADGMDDNIRARLDRITRLWIAPRQGVNDIDASDARAMEWRLALEGFGKPADFADSARIFDTSAVWRSVTPFVAAGHLKAAGYPGEVRRLVRNRGMDARFGFNNSEVVVTTLRGTPRRAIRFHRFRLYGHEAQYDTSGAFLEIVFPRPVEGPLALGYGSHFGLGLFTAVAGAPRKLQHV